MIGKVATFYSNKFQTVTSGTIIKENKHTLVLEVMHPKEKRKRNCRAPFFYDRHSLARHLCRIALGNDYTIPAHLKAVTIKKSRVLNLDHLEAERKD